MLIDTGAPPLEDRVRAMSAMKMLTGPSTPAADPPGTGSDLVASAAAILLREAGQLSRGLEFPLPGKVSGLTTNSPESKFSLNQLPAASPSGIDVDGLRRLLHNYVETLISTFNPRVDTASDRVPVIRGGHPITAGAEIVVPLRVINEGPTSLEVSLYCSNLVSDGGFDISALHIGFAPRACVIAAESAQVFDVTIRVPQQAPPASYSGLVQAVGTKYFKVVMSIEVR
jgi:hypothetical protein